MKKPEIPQPPEGLCTEAKRFWQEVCGDWEFKDSEIELLRIACWALHRYYEAKSSLDREGVVLESKGLVRKNPALEAERVSRQAFLAAVKALKLELENTKRPVGRPPHGF